MVQGGFDPGTSGRSLQAHEGSDAPTIKDTTCHMNIMNIISSRQFIATSAEVTPKGSEK